MKIYTKTGDTGETQLFGTTRVAKSDLRLECYGTLDELNSVLALALETETSVFRSLHLKIQDHLFVMGSWLACDSTEMQVHLPALNLDLVPALESAIDQMTAELPPLKTFVIPGGCESNSRFHLARTVTRRAERCCVEFLNQHSDFAKREEVLVFLNRLSDYLFTRARYASLQQNRPELLWNAKA